MHFPHLQSPRPDKLNAGSKWFFRWGRQGGSETKACSVVCNWQLLDGAKSYNIELQKIGEPIKKYLTIEFNQKKSLSWEIHAGKLGAGSSDVQLASQGHHVQKLEGTPTEFRLQIP